MMQSEEAEEVVEEESNEESESEEGRSEEGRCEEDESEEEGEEGSEQVEEESLGEEGEEEDEDGEAESEEDDGEAEGEEEEEESDNDSAAVVEELPPPPGAAPPPVPMELMTDMKVMHDCLGMVTIIKVDGSESWQDRKALVQLPAKGKLRPKPVNRWVFKDALSPLEPAPAERMMQLPPSSAAAERLPSSAGVAAVELTLEEVIKARTCANISRVLPAPQKAVIERARKTKRLREAKKRPRRPKMGVRKTKEHR
ncbi:hypothetical protein AB1Y20_004179 [Prymnesium parvum]|uniref:Ribosome biogenesis protein NOP53 n=1 Tax=Prymnesium parvum TaxID=97485 RepID=A0AB34J987_PRYPA